MGNPKKKKTNSFDLQDFIIDTVKITLPDFSDDGEVEKTICTERYYAELFLLKYKNRIKYDGNDWWIYDDDIEFWEIEEFVNVKIWNYVCSHFRKEEDHYKAVFNGDFDKKYPASMINEMDKSKKEKFLQKHPFIIFKKHLINLHKTHKELMWTNKYLANSVLDYSFIAKSNPIGLINVFQIEQKKEWRQHEYFVDEEYFEMVDFKSPIMIDLNNPGVVYERHSKYLMTHELDVIIGQSSKSEINQLEQIIFSICNSDKQRMEQVLLGYALALCGTTKAYTFCHTGNGSNGKSILKALFQTAFKPFVLNVNSCELVKRAKGGRDKFHSSLSGKRILLVEELDEQEIDVEELKMLSGNSEITFKGLYKQKTIDILYNGRLFIFKNNELNVGQKGADGGLARRIKIVEHSNKFVSPEIKEEKYNNNDNILAGDPELEKRVLNGEYNTIFVELILELLKEMPHENWDKEFGKETEELLNDSQCEVTDWLEQGLVIGTGVLGHLTLHDIFDAISDDLPSLKIKELKTKIKQHFKQRHPNIEIEDCRYYHNKKRERGFKLQNTCLGANATYNEQIDELDK